jgi:hypothetical protein
MDRSNPRPDATRAAAGVPSGGFAPALALDVAGVQRRLEAGNGDEIVHASPGRSHASLRQGGER